MSKKRCIRKHWNTAANFNAVQHAIAGACVTSKTSLDALQVRELSALESITRGLGTLQDWRDLADVVNLCETAARMGVGPEALPACAAAQEVLDAIYAKALALPACAAAQETLLQAANRFKSSSKMGVTGVGIAALRDVMEYHHLQRQSISRSQYEQIIAKTVSRVRSHTGEVVRV